MSDLIRRREMMKNDLISRQDVLDYINTMPSELTSDGRRTIRRMRLTEYIANTLPSVESRKKGEWVDGMLYYDFEESEWEKIKCSVCKNFVVKQIFYHDNKYHFCPNCGAKMERKR